MAKLASQANFEWLHGNLDHLSYIGSQDLHVSTQSSSYVPEHAKGFAKLETLVATKESGHKPPSGSVQSIAPKVGTQHSPKPSAPQFSGMPVPTVHTMGFVWQKHVQNTTKTSVGKLSQPQWGQLKNLRAKLGPAVMGVLEYSAQNWSTFGAAVVSQTGYPAAPSVPNIGFLCKYCQIALELAYKAAVQKVPKSPCEWNLVKTYPTLQKNLGLA